MPRRAVQPLRPVESGGLVQGYGVAMEEVGHADEVAVGGELVGHQLGVDEGVADDVGEEEDAG